MASSADHDEATRRRAYELWERAGREDGREQEFWFAAEAAIGDPEAPASTPREQTGESKGIAPGPSGMEQTDDQDNLINNVSNIG